MMRRFIIVLALAAVIPAAVSAKGPKWVKNARMAVCQIVAFDEEGNEKGRSIGFFTDSDGNGITTYDIFSTASKAVAIDANQVRHDIICVTGANRIYDLARFKTVPDKTMKCLNVSSQAASGDTPLYIMRYSSEKSSTADECTAASISPMSGEFSYYALSGKMFGDIAGAPLLNADGMVVGVLQSSNETDTCHYAADSRFAASLSISSALTLNEDDYRRMKFEKALPETEEQALVYLYLNQGGDKATYANLVDKFLKQYPDSYEGYLKKGRYLILSGDSTMYGEGVSYLDKAVSLAGGKGAVYYEYADLIYSVLTSQPAPFPDGWTLDSALDYADKAIAADEAPSYTQLKGNILFAKHEYDEALLCYQAVNKSSIASPETYYYTSVIKSKLEADPDEIIATLDSCINFYGKPYTSQIAPFILERATTKEGFKRYREAVIDLNEYEQVIGSAQLSAEFYYFREQIEVKAKMYEQAIRDIGTAVSMLPSDLGLALEQVSLMLRTGLYEQAMPIISKLVESNPDNADCQRLAGICHMQTGDNTKARTHFLKAKELGDELAVQLLDSLD